MVLRDDASYHRVVVVGPHFIVKHGRGVLEREGQTLLFLQKHLNNIVTGPKLYAMFRMASTGHLCLIMQRLSGESLETMWPTLDEDGKTTICRKLKEFFATIRRIPSPGFYGSVERGSMPHHLFYSAEGDRSICGPFTSELELNAAFVKKLREIWATNGKHSFKADFYEANLDTMLNSHKPVFSHSDLQAKNIWFVIRRLKAAQLITTLKYRWWTGKKQAGIQTIGNMLPYLLVSCGQMTGLSD